MFTDTDIAWLAGVFDGEGCVYVLNSRRRGGRVVRSLSLALTNTSSALVEKYISILRGGGLSPQVILEPSYTKRPAYYVKVARKAEALVLARAILPYATSKRLELLLAVEYLERACATRQHVATQQDIEVLDAITAAKRAPSVAIGN